MNHEQEIIFPDHLFHVLECVSSLKKTVAGLPDDAALLSQTNIVFPEFNT